MKIYQGHQFSVSMPNVWEGEYDDEDHYDVLYNEKGVGELQISAVIHDRELTGDDLLNIASEDIHAGAKYEEVELGDFDGITFDYDTENEYWCEWYLGCGDLILFVTYNCPLNKEGEDAEDVELIMGTLKRVD